MLFEWNGSSLNLLNLHCNRLPLVEEQVAVSKLLAIETRLVKTISVHVIAKHKVQHHQLIAATVKFHLVDLFNVQVNCTPLWQKFVTYYII